MEKKPVFEMNPINDDKELKKRVFRPINLENIDLESFNRSEFIESEEYKYSPCTHPFYKVCQTLLMIAEVYASKSQGVEALKIYDYISSIYLKLFGTDDTIHNSYCI